MSRFPAWTIRVLLPLLTFTFLVAFWEFAVNFWEIRPTILPAPSRIVEQAWIYREPLLEHTRATLTVTLIGFGCSLVFSWAVAIACDFSKVLRLALTPLLVASQTIPLIVIAPLMIIWFGFGLLPKILLVILVTFFPTTLGLIEGLASSPQSKLQLVHSMGARRFKTFWYLRLPHALPAFFTALRIAITYAVVGAIFAEYAGAKYGLGVFMAVQKNAFRTDLVLAGVFVTALLSISLFSLVYLAQRFLAPWSLKQKTEAGGIFGD